MRSSAAIGRDGMKGQGEVLDHRQVFVSTNPVPSRPIAILSLLAHLVVLAGIVALVQMPRGHVVEQKYPVTNISGPPHLGFSPAIAKGSSRRLRVPRVDRRVRNAMAFVPVGAREGTASKTVVERARKASAAIVADLKQPFALGGHVPTWVWGDFPILPAAEFPPHFEQLLVLEITIDVDGSVVQATIVSGSVALSIEHKLLKAILGFKYNPARRFGATIPSQLDLVVHVPS